jgi:threonine synthase
VAVTGKLLKQGRLDRRALTVLCVTGNGLKTADLMEYKAADLAVIEPKYSAYQAYVNSQQKEEKEHYVSAC